MSNVKGRLLAAILSSCAFSGIAQAQTGSNIDLTPDLVITATRTPQAISRAGSAISVITAEEIAKEAPKSVADLFRRVPGVTVSELGGPGSTTTLRIRGAEARQTLVLIDGIRVNDPSGGGEFDFSQLVLTDIERIEVLRGPQSALYGSDAIGGVVNIISRKGRGAPRGYASAEGGSYASKAARAGVSGSTGAVSYAFSVTGYEAAGFSRFGHRIRRIERTRPFPLEDDSAQRLGASTRLGVALSENADIEFGGYASLNRAEYDAAFGDFPDTPSKADQRLAQGYTRFTALTFDGLLRNTILVSANRTDRTFDDFSYFGVPVQTGRRDRFVGDRVAAEYQGEVKLNAFGLLTFGSKIERERAITDGQNLAPVPGPNLETNDASQLTRSIFALHQISLWENLHLSLGGRLDDVRDIDRFGTWRATAAYEVPASNTTFRTSIGTAAKAPSLFQLFDPTFGTPNLVSERSVGFDVGVDQRLFDDRLILSATVFSNRFRDFIDFSFDPLVCPATNPFGCFINVARAKTSGIELSGDLDLVPSWVRLRAAYTYLEAFDEITGDRLARRPTDEARLGFAFTPIRGLSIEPTVVLVGSRFSSSGEVSKLAPYARLDVYANYRIDDTFSVFARAENLTDAHYEDVRDYGTAGRSFSAGLSARW